MVIVPCRRGVPPGGICSIAHVPANVLGAGAAIVADGADAATKAANKSFQATRNMTRLTIAPKVCCPPVSPARERHTPHSSLTWKLEIR
jgi:hypothetical protein